MNADLTVQLAQMEGKVATLRQLWGQLAAETRSWGFDVSGGSASAAAESLLQRLNQAIANLDAARALVAAKVRTFESWWSEASAHEQTMRSQLGEAASYTLSNYVANATAATAGEVAQGAGQIASAAKSGTTWGVLAAAVVLFVVWRLS